MSSMFKRVAAVIAACVLAAGALAACGSDDSDTSATTEGGGSGGQTLTIGYIPWDEDIAVSYLWKNVLENKGYDVELKQLDVAPTFVGLTKGDIDVFFDTWLPTTHADYWDKYGDQLEDLGSWYDNASLTIAVPEYVDAKEIGDLKDMAGELDGKIVGIESGAGLTRVTKEEAMPTYGLEDFNLQTSSTQAMLAALKKATDNQEPIAVTLWHPHWAYDAYPIRDLEDPEGAMGGAETIHTVAKKGFSEEFPEVAEAMKKFQMSDEELGSLENVVLQKNENDPEKGVEEWIKENQAFADSMLDE